MPGCKQTVATGHEGAAYNKVHWRAFQGRSCQRERSVVEVAEARPSFRAGPPDGTARDRTSGPTVKRSKIRSLAYGSFTKIEL